MHMLESGTFTLSSLTIFTSSIQTTMAKSESKVVQRNKRSRTPPQTISPWPRTLIMCSVALAVVAALALLWLPARVNDGYSISTVERKRYDGTLNYRQIAEMRQPLMLTETIVDRWPARKQFTTKFLANKIRHVKAHIQEDARSFITFHDNKPLEDYVPEQWENFNLKVNTTIPTVLQWGEEGTDPSKGPFLYYTQDMATMRQFPNVIGYIQPVQDLFLSDKNVQVNLWVGREGIVTHAHYDCTYNFFFQLQGRKRFTLYPPSDHLYLYPCLHPHYGHSQVDILNPDNKKFPLFKSARSVVAEVRPGDMLVVPPFWFHHVETLEESVSVNVWSDAPEYDLINQVYSLPIPFEDSWSTEEKVVATKVYISMILSHFEIQYIEFLQHLLEQRYEILIGDERLRFNSSVSDQVVHTCTSDQKWNQHHTVYEPFLRKGVDATVLLLQKISMRSILKVCIGNFIEHLIHRVLSLDNIFSFLKHCSV